MYNGLFSRVQHNIKHKTKNRLQEKLLLDSVYKKEFKQKKMHSETNHLNTTKFDLTKMQDKIKKTENDSLNFKINTTSRFHSIKTSCYRVHVPKTHVVSAHSTTKPNISPVLNRELLSLVPTNVQTHSSADSKSIKVI